MIVLSDNLFVHVYENDYTTFIALTVTYVVLYHVVQMDFNLCK